MIVRCISLLILASTFYVLAQEAYAGPLLDRIRERRANASSQERGGLLKGDDMLQAKEGKSSYYLTFEGNQRGYELHIPRSVKSNPSLIIMFHGGKGNASRVMGQNNIRSFADRDGFIVAYPNALNGRWSDGRNTTEGSNDVGYIRALIDKLSKTHNVNRDAVFVTGPSNGGAMSHRMACDAGDVIAGFAPVVANISVDLHSKCHPKQAVPIVMFMGVDDKLMPFNGGTSDIAERHHNESGNGVLSFEQTKQFWLKNNDCSNQMEPYAKIDNVSDDDTAVIPQIYNHCSGNVQSHFYVIEGGGHNWPGGKADFNMLVKRLIGNVSQEIDASAAMVQFFKQYGL